MDDYGSPGIKVPGSPSIAHDPSVRPLPLRQLGHDALSFLIREGTPAYDLFNAAKAGYAMTAVPRQFALVLAWRQGLPSLHSPSRGEGYNSPIKIIHIASVIIASFVPGQKIRTQFRPALSSFVLFCFTRIKWGGIPVAGAMTFREDMRNECIVFREVDVESGCQGEPDGSLKGKVDERSLIQHSQLRQDDKNDG